MADRLYSPARASPPRRRLIDSRDSYVEKPSKGGQMQGLLKEFRGVYESRLKRLDEAEKAGENTEKVNIT